MRQMIGYGLVGLLCLVPATTLAQADRSQATGRIEYRVQATTRTSTMAKEMNEAADAGFRYDAVMGGETAIGGKEVVTVMSRVEGVKEHYQYQLLATNRTSTMQRELQDAAERGFEYRGQTVFESLMGGREVVCILERNVDRRPAGNYVYKLLATTKTSTMERELQQSGADGFEVVGLTIGKTALGGSELVTIMRRKVR
ncbi:MAG: hypothetical protein ABI652_03385 [Acidobacteriota bacterium]